MKVRFEIEIALETDSPEEELSSRKQQNIVGALRRLLTNRCNALKGLQSGTAEWGFQIKEMAIEPRTRT